MSGSEFWVAAGTIMLAAVGLLQIVMEARRRAHENRPWLILTGGRWSRDVCRVEVCNLSTRPIAIDGVYADWHISEPDSRLKLDETSGRLSKYRTILGPGELVTRYHPFPQAEGHDDGLGEPFGGYTRSQAVLTVAFHYPSAGRRLKKWRWEVLLVDDELKITPVGRHR